MHPMPPNQRRHAGFTLVELLVVIAIIGVLTTIAVASLTDSRRKARDLKRVSSIRQVQTALELYNNDYEGYPPAATAVVLGTGNQRALCTGGWKAVCDPGDVVFLSPVPAASLPVDTGCTAAQNDFTYTAAPGANYSLTFCIGSATGYLSAGAHTADPNGIQ